MGSQCEQSSPNISVWLQQNKYWRTRAKISKWQAMAVINVFYFVSGRFSYTSKAHLTKEVLFPMC